MHTKKAGDSVGRYVVEAPLGSGGMGEVYEARDTRLGRKVALKILRSDAEGPATKRLLREAQAAASLDHPNAVVVYDVGQVDGEMFIAMELVRGKAVRSLLDDASVPTARKLRWLVDAARALAAAHSAGLIHRDVKPDNIVVRDDGVAKVLDFGIARKQSPAQGAGGAGGEAELMTELATVTAEGSLVGTPRYWAPEQLRGEEIDGRVDQFAWGVTAYELLSGEPPWTADEPVKLLSQILTADAPKLRARAPDVPEEVERALVKALSKRADERFATMDEAADAIEPFADAPVGAVRSAAPGGGKPEGEVKSSAPPTLSMTREADDELPKERAASQRGQARGSARWIAPIGALAIGAAAIVVGARAVRSRSPTEGGRSDGLPRLVVSSLSCAEAKLEGSGALPELAAPIGVGACARLAVELGVEWTVTSGGERARVSAKLEGGGAELSMAVGDKAASARGASPLEAMNAVAEALAGELAAPPMKPDEVSAWGAKDEASARRIRRALRRVLLDFGPDDQVLAKELVETTPESALTYYIATMAELGGLEKKGEWQTKALELSRKLPPAREKTLRALLEKERLDAGERLRLLRQAYAEASDDTFVAGSYGNQAVAVGAEEEGFAVLDRLHARTPSGGIWHTYKILEKSPRRDLEREGRYIARIEAILPETAAWQGSVVYDVLRGDIAGARRRLALGLNLGTAGTTQSSFYAESARAWVELAAFEPAAARELASKMVGEPRPIVAAEGTSTIIASYLLEGRIDDAEEAALHAIDRYRDGADTQRAIRLTAMAIRLRRMLGRSPPPEARVAWLRAALDEREKTLGGAHVLYRMELELAVTAAEPSPTKRKAAAEKALAELEAAAAKNSRGDRLALETALLKTLPLVRVARGDAEAAKLWREMEKASFWTRLTQSFDAGLALAAVGDLAKAEEAFVLSQDVTLVQEWTLQILAARVKLAALYRAQKRDAEAAKLEEVVTRLWAGADKGLREAIQKLR